VPQRSTFAPRRQVAASATTGITESHRYDSKQSWIVERVTRDSKPIAKGLTGNIVPRNTGFANLSARRLSNDQDARMRVGANYRSWGYRHLTRTYSTVADLNKKFVQLHNEIQRCRPGSRHLLCLSTVIVYADAARATSGKSISVWATLLK
jgi:hypothetical protein